MEQEAWYNQYSVVCSYRPAFILAEDVITVLQEASAGWERDKKPFSEKNIQNTTQRLKAATLKFCHSAKPRGACLRTEICEGLKHLAARAQKVLLYVTRGHLALAPGAFVFSFSRPYQIGFHSRTPGDMQRNRCGKALWPYICYVKLKAVEKDFTFDSHSMDDLVSFCSGLPVALWWGGCFHENHGIWMDMVNIRTSGKFT